jgi:hypothetical protein
MIRKITKNKHQYKVSLPIELLRKMQWDDETLIKFQEVDTPLGKGIIILEHNDELMKVDLK